MEIMPSYIGNQRLTSSVAHNVADKSSTSNFASADTGEYIDYSVHISSEALSFLEEQKERDMTTAAVSSNHYTAYHNQYHKCGDASNANFNDYLCAELAGPDEQAAVSNAQSSVFQISSQAPWPTESPFKKEQDRFMELFQQAFDEVLAEKGLASGSSQSVAIPEKEMSSIQAKVADKLYLNREAKQLMTLLEVDLKTEGMETDEDVLTSMLGGDLAGLEKRLYEDLGPEKYKEYIDMSNNSTPRIPGLYSCAYGFPKSGNSMMSDMASYKLYVARVHDEVVSELGLDPSQVEEDSEEALAALKMIGERIMNDPEGQLMMHNLGLTSVNYKGMPTAADVDVDGKGAPTPNPDFEDEDFLEMMEQKLQEASASKTTANWDTKIKWKDLVKSLTTQQLAINLKLQGIDYSLL